MTKPKHTKAESPVIRQPNLEYYRAAFGRVGWFIPPYVTLGFLGSVAKHMQARGSEYQQGELEAVLAHVYSDAHLAPMVVSRYSSALHVQDYKQVIAEAVEAHFMGLNHVAVSGLLPVVEGVVMRLGAARGLPPLRNKRAAAFLALAKHCREEVQTRQIGQMGEVISMIDSFLDFTEQHLYADSDAYPLSDKSNRNGISHGRYADDDYGSPLNFYKVISCVDMLCFISSFWGGGSWFAPPPNAESDRLLQRYQLLRLLAKTKATALRSFD